MTIGAIIIAEKKGKSNIFRNYKSCYKHKFRHIKRQWVKRRGNLSQRSQKVLWNKNSTYSVVWSCVLMHNGQAKKKKKTQTKKSKTCLHPQCNFGRTWPPQSTGGIETQTSQSSSKVIGIKIFTSKQAYPKFHYWPPERLPNTWAPLRLFSAQQPGVPRQQEEGPSQDKAIYAGLVVAPSTLLLTPALIYSHHEPFNGAQAGKPNLQKNSPEQLGLLGVLVLLTYAAVCGLAQRKAAVSLYYSTFTIVRDAGHA